MEYAKSIIITIIIIFSSYSFGNLIMEGSIFPDTDASHKFLASVIGFMILLVIVGLTLCVHKIRQDINK